MLALVYATMILLLIAVGFAVDSWQFWCFFGVLWATSRTSRQIGREEATEIIARAMKRLDMDIEKLYKELDK